MSTKITAESLLKLAKKLGADVEIAEADDATLSIDTIAEQVELHAIEARKPAIEQEVAERVKTDYAGEVGDLQRKQIMKRFGITDKALLQGKSLEQMLEIGKEYHAKELNKNVEEWNKDKEALVNTHMSEKEAWENEKKSIVKDWETKYNERDVIEALRSHMEKVPRTGGDLQMQTKLWKSSFAEKGIEPRFNAEKGEIEFYKGNQLFVENGKTLKAEDLAKEFAKNGGFLAESTNKIAPSRLAEGKTNGEFKPMPADSPYAQVLAAVGEA